MIAPVAPPDAATPPRRLSRAGSLALRAAVTIALLVGLITWATPDAVLSAVRGIDPARWLLVCVAILGSTLLGAVNLHALLHRHSGQRFGAFLRVYWIGWAFGTVVPGQVGDIATMTVALSRQGVDWRGTLGRALVDKAISLLVMLLLAALALADTWAHLVLRMDWNLPLGAMALAGGTTLLALTVAGAWARGRSPALHEHFRRVVAAVTELVRTRPGLLILNAALTLVKTLLIGAAYWMALRALGDADPGFWRTLTLAMAGGLVAYVPISLNGVGAVEAAAILLFGIHGVAASTVVTAYLMLRASVLVLAWVPAGLALAAAPARADA